MKKNLKPDARPVSSFYFLTPSNFVKINPSNLIFCMHNSLMNLQGVLWSKMKNLKILCRSSGGQPVCTGKAMEFVLLFPKTNASLFPISPRRVFLPFQWTSTWEILTSSESQKVQVLSNEFMFGS